MKPIAMAVSGAALASAVSSLGADELEPLLPKLGAESLDERKGAREAFESVCLRASRPDAEAERVAAAQAVVAMLAKEVPQTTRVFLIRQLMLIGAAECVGALTPILTAAEAEVRDAARRAMQKNPAPEAAEALRKALAAAKEPAGRIAFVNALGGRTEKESVDPVAACLSDADEAVARAAAVALAQIGGPEAVTALAAAKGKAPAPLRPAIADALCQCAERYMATGRYAEAKAVFTALDAAEESDRAREAARTGLAAVELSEKAGRVAYPEGGKAAGQ